jgi:hypothetical protein
LRRLNAYAAINPKKVEDILHNLDNEELAHHGVKGMKWGVRKADRTERTSRIRKYSQRRTLNEEELKKTVSRMKLEKEFKSLAAEDIAPGIKAVNDLLAKMGSTALMAAAGAAGAKLATDFIKNKIGG